MVSRLASSIGLSKELFRNINYEVDDESDRGLEIAAKVFTAAIDEHGDPNIKNLTHRMLSQASLRKIGEYAQLTPQIQNKLATIPDWLVWINQQVIENYQGQPGNLESLIKAIGFHAASEMLAHRKFSTIDRIVRHENKEIGFDKYLKSGNGKVKFEGHEIGGWSWIVIHGSYSNSGVEQIHFQKALEAINLVIRYSPANYEKILQWILVGFNSFVVLQQGFFRKIRQECLELTDEF